MEYIKLNIVQSLEYGVVVYEILNFTMINNDELIISKDIYGTQTIKHSIYYSNVVNISVDKKRKKFCKIQFFPCCEILFLLIRLTCYGMYRKKISQPCCFTFTMFLLY